MSLSTVAHSAIVTRFSGSRGEKHARVEFSPALMCPTFAGRAAPKTPNASQGLSQPASCGRAKKQRGSQNAPSGSSGEAPFSE